MKLVVGLGNPGQRYARSRHNVGFRVVSRFAAEHGIALEQEDFRGIFGRGTLDCGQGTTLEVGVLRPLTYMNLSGDAVDFSDGAAFYFRMPSDKVGRFRTFRAFHFQRC